jgi:apolipoprotein N-acyltransferase
VDRTGRGDRKLLRPFEQGFAAFDIDLVAAPLTTYSRRGDWLAHIAAGITCAALAWRGTRWLRRRSHR